MEEKNQLIKDKNGIISLAKNGVKCFCYRQSIAYVEQQQVATLINTPTVLKQPCTNACPAFKIFMDKQNNLPVVSIGCSGVNIQYLINGGLVEE